MKYFQSLLRPKQFTINKGNIKLVSEAGNYLIKYPDHMEGSISIDQSDTGVTVDIKKDFASGEALEVNLNGLPECNVTLFNGALRTEYTCPNMKLRVDSGTLSAKLAKTSTGSVKAHVDSGVITNNSDLTKTGSDYMSSLLSILTGMNIGAGINNHVELMGDVESQSAVFEVGSGTIDLNQ